MSSRTYGKSASKFSMEFGRTTGLLGDFDPETGVQVSDVPLAMESPVKRPVPATRWKTMARDSLRPDPPATVISPSGMHRGWARMAAGRPPHQSWKRQVWLFLSEDRLCWVSEEDLHQHAGNATGSPSPVAMTLYPSASAALAADSSAAVAAVEQLVGAGLPLINYIPLDRIPVRSTPRGYVPGSAISRVANTQVVQQGLGAAFAVTAGSHTLFFSAASEAEADKWVEAIQDAWTHCTMNVLRCVQAPGTTVEQAQSNEQMLAAMNSSLRFEQQQLITELQQVEARHASQLARVRLENVELQQQMQRTPRYEVEVSTSTARGAGTDSRVFVNLTGRSGHHSGERQLTRQPDTSMQPQLFKRGSRECFLVCCADIGVVSVVELRQDASGSKPHWQPDWLRVRKVQDKGPPGPWTEFPLGTWLSREKGMARLSLRLEAGQPPGNWITYKVVIQTSPASGAGTQAQVSLRMVFKSVVIEHDVHADPDDFARGGEAHVVVKCLEQGGIQELWLGHTNEGQASDWLVESVTLHKCTLQGKALQPIQRFQPSGWVRGPPGAASNPVRLTPCQPSLQEVPWTMRVHTGRQKGAGTDANVFIWADMQAEGSTGFQVAEIALPSNPGYYEAGCVDEFTVFLPKAQIQKLHVRHDNMGHGADWFLDFISLQCQDTGSRQGSTTYFPCFSWLKDDGHVSCLKRALSPCIADPRQELVTYTCDIHTSQLPDAGTDANAYIELVGSKGTSGKVVIEAPGSLKASSCAQVTMERHGLGPLVSCTLFLDASHGNASWRVDKVDIMAQPCPGGPPDVLTFWFCTRLAAWAGEDMASASRESSSSLAAAPQTYKVTVKTSSMKGAGTDDDVLLSLCGTEGSADELPLAASASAFEAGSCDTFKLLLPFLGKLETAALVMGPGGARPGWHLAWLHVTVEEAAAADGRAVTGAPDEFRFVHKGWVDQRDSKGRRTTGPMTPVSSYDPFEEVLVSVETVTCMEKGAGTDAEVYVRAHSASALGEASVSGWARLPAVVESLERGLTDTFEVMLSGVTGRLQKLDVKVEASALEPEPSWSFEHIKVGFERLSNGQALHEDAFFNGPCALTAAAPKATLPASRESVWCSYRVTVWTASTKHAGTDGDVQLRLEGSLSATAAIKVAGLPGDFLPGSKTVKTVRHPRIGSIQGLAFATDAAADLQGWDVVKVLVEEDGTGNSAWFACPGRIPRRKLKSLTKFMDDPELSMLTVKVSVTTATTWQADTDSTAWVILVGSQRPSDKLELLSDAHTAFQKGATDSFTFQIHDIGELQALDVGHNNDGASPSWCPEQITVTLEKGQHSGSQALFYHNQMIPASRGALCSTRLLPSVAAPTDKQGYRIRTCTGDKPGSCLDHPVKVLLYGDGAVPPEDLAGVLASTETHTPGRAGPFVLEVPDSAEEPFRRSAQNTFTVTGAPLRSVTHVVVGHECALQSWHLTWLEVQLNGQAAATRRFYCHGWLSLSRGQGRLQACLSSTTDPMATYSALVRTGDCRCAGTSADVKVELHGASGRSGAVALLDTAVAASFRRGCCDDFQLQCLGVGPLQALSVVCETPEDHEKAWFLDWIAVQPNQNAPWVYFSFNCWIPSNRSITKEAQATHPETARSDYRVVVKTAGAPGFVDSAVTLAMHGPSGSQHELQLCPSADTVPAAPCDCGHEDVFLLRGVPLSSVQRVSLTADTAAGEAPWFLQWVRVINCISGDTQLFTATSLFGPAALSSSGPYTHELRACSEKEKDVFGFVKVEASSAAGSGTPLAGRVYLTVDTASGVSVPDFLLANPQLPYEQLFGPGSTQAFVHRLPAADAVTSVKLRFGVAGEGLPWRPTKVVLTDMATGVSLAFEPSSDSAAADVRSGTGGFAEVVLERAAPQQPPALSSTAPAAQHSHSGLPGERTASAAGQLCDYELTLHTEPSSAARRLQLLVNLEGDAEPHETGQRACRAIAARGAPAVAAVEHAPDVGILSTCHLAVLRSGDGADTAGVTLAAVAVENTATGAVYHCEPRRELAGFVAGDDGRLQPLQLVPGQPGAAATGAARDQCASRTCREDLERTQTAPTGSLASTRPATTGKGCGTGAAAALGKTASLLSQRGGYTIAFRIRGVALSGPHAHVSFQLVGSVCNSGVEAVSADHFTNDSTTFLEYATMPFCGDVQALRLRISGRCCLVHPRLALQGVDVTCLTSRTTYSFGAVVVDRKHSFAVTLQRPLKRTDSGVAHTRPHAATQASLSQIRSC
eukprot:jgi/Ulvmu1/2960/UM149_0043.1